MTGLEEMAALLLPEVPSRLKVAEIIERLLKKERAARTAEFTLYPVGFKSQEDFQKEVQRIWNEGYRANVVVSIGDKEP
jgi:hypothetical protein